MQFAIAPAAGPLNVWHCGDRRTQNQINAKNQQLQLQQQQQQHPTATAIAIAIEEV